MVKIEAMTCGNIVIGGINRAAIPENIVTIAKSRIASSENIVPIP